MKIGRDEGGVQRWTGDIHQGDAAETLAKMPESSVHCSMTSPPYYGLRDYGVDGQLGLEDSLDEYIEALVEIAEELKRVLRDDGSWWLNLGDSFASKPGWGSQSDRVGGHDAGLDHGKSDRLDRKQKMLVPHRVAIALQEAGWIIRGDTVWEKPNPMPSPVKDRMNEVKEYVFHLTPSPDYWFDLTAVREPYTEQTRRRARRAQRRGVKRQTDEAPGNHEKSGGIHDESVPRSEQLHPGGKNPGDVWEISVKSFPEAHFAVYPPELCERPILASCPPKVCAECGAPHERETEVVEREVGGGSPAIAMEGTGYKDRTGNHQGDRDGFTQPTKRRIGPWRPTCDCETEETVPGITIDPFTGAGTTCHVAKRLGRRFVGIELNPDYVAMAQKRVGVTVSEPERLLDEGETALTAFADGGGSHD